jgi:hypothetical protein
MQDHGPARYSPEGHGPIGSARLLSEQPFGLPVPIDLLEPVMTELSLFSRRTVLRTVAGGLLAIPAGVGAIESAEAGRGWCLKDPDVYLEGTFVRVDVAVPEEYVALVNGPTLLRFNLPSQVDRQFAWTDEGFNGLGYQVTFSTAFQPNKPAGKFSVNLSVSVPIRDGTKVPIWCKATPAKGTTAERTGNDAKTGTSLNFTVLGSL